jgi:nitroreductase
MSISRLDDLFYKFELIQKVDPQGTQMENMTLEEAIEKRSSRRSYLSTPMDPDRLQTLKSKIDDLNRLSGLSIRLVEDGGQSFDGLMKSYGLFHGVGSFFAMAGKTTDPDLLEKVGYYGEQLVLETTRLGLGTCWVGATFDRKNCPCTLREDEKLVCVIPVGNVEPDRLWMERTVYHLVHRGTKSVEQLYVSDVTPPEWFLRGVRAVQKAPSAMNRQPVRLIYRDGIALAEPESEQGFNRVDLGIAKANFEIAAGGKFTLGRDGRFIKG